MGRWVFGICAVVALVCAAIVWLPDLVTRWALTRVATIESCAAAEQEEVYLGRSVSRPGFGGVLRVHNDSDEHRDYRITVRVTRDGEPYADEIAVGPVPPGGTVSAPFFISVGPATAGGTCEVAEVRTVPMLSP